MSARLQDVHAADLHPTCRNDGILLSRVNSALNPQSRKLPGHVLSETVISGFTCGGQNYCVKSLNTKSTMTYVDSTLSTQRTIYAITATPIQIRFKAAQSTTVPVPTESLKLPKHFLSRSDKVKIGVAVPVVVILLSVAAFFGCRHWRARRERGGGASASQVHLTEDRPPPYSGNDENTRSRMDRMKDFVRR